jgi:hypothetical protein
MFDSDEFNRMLGEELATNHSRAWEILGQNPVPDLAVEPSSEGLSSFSGDFFSVLDLQGSSSVDVTSEQIHR